MSQPEHTILVAFTVYAANREDAQRRLMRLLPRPSRDGIGTLDSWWIAEDDRIDGSDNDSAVFVPMGSQQAAVRSLTAMEKM